jgi:PAS domain S-box-containing protein
MKRPKILPFKFSSRLIAMTLLSGLVPIIIFTLLMQIAAVRFPSETNQAIQQGQAEQWRRMEVVLRNMAEEFIHQKAKDVALEIDLYLGVHPTMTVVELQQDPLFRDIAVQSVGTSYTAVFNSETAVNCFHQVASLQGMDISTTADKWPIHWAIIKSSLGGKDSKGYYSWKDSNGKSRDKFMYIAPCNIRTADGVRFAVAATTYVDEFYSPLYAAQEVSKNTSNRLMQMVNGRIRSFNNRGFLIMGLGLLLVVGFSYWVGTYFSRAITHLRNATNMVNQGDFDHRMEPIMSGDVGELIKDFNQMVSQLATTTVKKEQFKASEERLKIVNAQLMDEIADRKKAEEAMREGRERFRSIVENSHDGISIVDTDYHLLYFNKEWCIIMGYTADEMIGRDFREFLSHESRFILEDRNVRREKGSPFPKRFEFDIHRKNGEIRRVEATDSLTTGSKITACPPHGGHWDAGRWCGS